MKDQDVFIVVMGKNDKHRKIDEFVINLERPKISGFDEEIGSGTMLSTSSGLKVE